MTVYSQLGVADVQVVDTDGTDVCTADVGFGNVDVHQNVINIYTQYASLCGSTQAVAFVDVQTNNREASLSQTNFTLLFRSQVGRIFTKDLSKAGCTKCFKRCPTDAIVGAAKQIHTVIWDACTGCHACAQVCPTEAIILRSKPRTLKSWYWEKPGAAFSGGGRA